MSVSVGLKFSEETDLKLAGPRYHLDNYCERMSSVIGMFVRFGMLYAALYETAEFARAERSPAFGTFRTLEEAVELTSNSHPGRRRGMRALKMAGSGGSDAEVSEPPIDCCYDNEKGRVTAVDDKAWCML